MKKLTFLMWTLVFTSLFSVNIFAHDGEEDENSENNIVSGKTYLPFYYLDNGDYLGATFFSIMWFVLIKGVWELTLLIIGRSI